MPLLAFLACLIATTAEAQEALTASAIEDDVLQAVTGVVFVNQSAGDGNLQFNGAAVAINEGGAAVAFVSAVQLSDPVAIGAETLEVDAVARIDDDSFANGQGLISVNQAGGLNNQQVNVVSLALGLEGEILAEAELSQTRTDGPPAPEVAVEGLRQTHIGDDAFHEASGIIQVNQAAGISNTTFNRFSLIAGGSP